MRTAGIVSNRILDALAAGALVLSDRVEGLEEMLGDTVPTFSSQDELGSLIREYLAGPRTVAERWRSEAGRRFSNITLSTAGRLS